MSIPLVILLYDRGANGVPTTNNPVNIAGRVESYQDAIHDRFGYESAQVAWKPTRSEVLEWLRPDHLMRPVEVYSPLGNKMWEGFLSEIVLTIGHKKISYTIGTMANRVIVHYDTDAGGLGATTTYSNTASIALFGTKDRLLNASKVSATAAANRAQTALAEVAFPKSKQASQAGTGSGGDIALTLTFAGWYSTLDWLLTTNASTSSTVTSTQVTSLLTAYNGTNNWFSTSTASITATGLSDTEFIDADTTYRDKIETLLAHGNSSQQLLAWGVYDNRAFSIQTSARATPSTITYYESAQSGLIFDAYGNVVPAWDVRPNAMAQVVDLIDASLAGAAEGPTTKYVGRVRRAIGRGDVSVTLEPSDVEDIESIIANPTGAGPAGTSERQAAFERKVLRPTRTRVPSDTGSGGVVTPPTGGGTAGRVMQWASGGRSAEDSTLVKSGAGVLTLSASGSVTLTIDNSIRLANSGASSGDVLTYDGSKYAPSTPTAGVTGSGTTGRITAWTSSSAIGASTLIKSGAGVLTLSAAGTCTLTIDNSIRLANSGASSGDVLTYDGSKYAPSTPTAGVTGSGTTGRITAWTSSSAIGASTLIKSGAGVLTLSAAGTCTLTIGASGGTLNLAGGTLTLGPDLTTSGAGSTLTLSSAGAYTLTIPATGTAALGTGASTRLAYWGGTNTLTSTANLVWNAGVNKLVVNATIAVQGSVAGIDFYDRNTNSDLWSIYSESNELRFWEAVPMAEDDAGLMYRMSTTALFPSTAGAKDLGTASLYWNEINYKLLTDRGCLGWYDEGVELQDGRLVSDVEALKAIRPHPYKRTPAGAVRFDYTTLPRHVYRPAPIAIEPVYQRGGGGEYVAVRAGDPIGEDGAETTALISILIGAIKELEQRLVAGGL